MAHDSHYFGGRLNSNGAAVKAMSTEKGTVLFRLRLFLQYYIYLFMNEQFKCLPKYMVPDDKSVPAVVSSKVKCIADIARTVYGFICRLYTGSLNIFI